jgi:glycosyltransferase involved in cell wall biosynthesis
VISTIYVDYSEFDRFHRKDMIGFLAKIFSKNFIEYTKTVAKFLLRSEKVSSYKYFILGHEGSIKYLLNHASYLLPNSKSEYHRLLREFKIEVPYHVVVNAVDTSLFSLGSDRIQKNNKEVLCVARIEGRKNQINLIKGISGKHYQLKIIGSSSENQKSYVNECIESASDNIQFIPQVKQTDLIEYYKNAKVHVLPSWFETTGLSSLEAAAMGCNIVVSDKGDVREYFGDLAYYCDPDDPNSIASAIELAMGSPINKALQEKVQNEYTWEKAADQTLAAYKKVLEND